MKTRIETEEQRNRGISNFEVEHSTFLCSSVALVKPAQLHIQVKAMNVFVRCI